MLPQTFNLPSPRYMQFLLSLLHGGALFCLSFLSLPFWIMILLALSCSVSLAVCFLKAARWQRLVYLGKTNWLLYDQMGQAHEIRLLGHSVRTPVFVMVNFLESAALRRSSLLLFSKAMAKNEFRRLCVCLLQH